MENANVLTMFISQNYCDHNQSKYISVLSHIKPNDSLADIANLVDITTADNSLVLTNICFMLTQLSLSEYKRLTTGHRSMFYG